MKAPHLLEKNCSKLRSRCDPKEHGDETEGEAPWWTTPQAKNNHSIRFGRPHGCEGRPTKAPRALREVQEQAYTWDFHKLPFFVLIRGSFKAKKNVEKGYMLISNQTGISPEF